MSAGTVLVVSADVLFGDAVRETLERSDWTVVGVERDAVRALSVAARTTPDRVLVLGHPDRLRAETFVRRLSGRRSPARVVVVASDDGVLTGVLPRTTSIGDVIGALRSPPSISFDEESPSQEFELLASLTRRERTILTSLAHGRTRAQIAEELGVTPNTVRTHIQHLYAKLRLHTASDLVRFAARQGLGQQD